MKDKVEKERQGEKGKYGACNAKCKEKEREGFVPRFATHLTFLPPGASCLLHLRRKVAEQVKIYIKTEEN